MKRMICIFFSWMLAFSMNLTAYAENEMPQGSTLCTALVEAQTGMLLRGEQSDLPVPAGSQTKLMTVLLTAQAVESGKLSAEGVIRVPAAAEGAPGATVWLRTGEEMTLTDLLKAVIIGNANDAAIALACAVSGTEQGFVAEMNAEAFSLGLRNTRFADCTGLSPENITTAYELALLSRALLRYSRLTPIFTTWRDFLRGEETELVSENRLVRSEKGILGMKAGHGEDCGYTLSLAAERGGMQCIAVVLGCNEADTRFSVGRQLLETGFSQYTVTTPDFSAEFLRPVTVRHGMSAAVSAESGALRAAAVPSGESLTCSVILPEYLEAPVQKGDIIGEIAFYSGDTLLYESPLTAAEDVPYRGFSETLCLLLGNLFK